MILMLASFGEIAEYVLYILLAVAVLLLMILVHEAGHYVVGKLLGFTIEEFSIGFGPSFFSKTKKNGEKFSVRVIPLGGYCAFKGEDKEESDKTSFNNQKPWKRILVLIAGAFMNYLLALFLIGIMFFSYGQTCFKVETVFDTPEFEISESLNEGDIILSANGKNVYLTTDLMNALSGKIKGDSVEFIILRDGEIVSTYITMRYDAKFDNVEDVKPLFLALGTYSVDGEYMYSGLIGDSVKLGFFDTVGRTFEYSFKVAGTIFKVIGELLNGKLGLSSVGGTVTTVTATATAVKSGGLKYLLYISSFIGVNLAVFNLLPIPALDGSRIVFTLIEWIRKKPNNRKIENFIHTAGFVIILVFALIVDLQKCF